MKKYKAIIVDDEYLARSDLKAILHDIGSIEIIGEADSIMQACILIENNELDFVFLDIQLTGESGFDLLEFIHEGTEVLFVTAYDKYAIRAFEVNALDYLLKPVHPDRLKLALSKIEGKISTGNEKKNFEYNDNAFIKLDKAYRFLKICSICKIMAADDYSELHLNNGKKLLAHKSMKEWENRLPGQYFCRIHRSTIINIEEVEKIEPWFNRAFHVYLKNNDEPLVMSRRYFLILKKKLG